MVGNPLTGYWYDDQDDGFDFTIKLPTYKYIHFARQIWRNDVQYDHLDVGNENLSPPS